MSGEASLVTERADKTCPVVTLEEQRNIVESVLDMNFDELNSSLDSEAFIGLQVSTNNLQDVVMSKMKEWVDYEGSEKDDR